MAAKARTNLIAYGILIGACLAVALGEVARPDRFLSGPPSLRLFLSFRGTVVIGLLGLVGLFFLNRSTLRGLWDDDLSASRKLVVPFAVGIAIGLALQYLLLSHGGLTTIGINTCIVGLPALA